MSFYTLNPATGGVLHSYEYATDEIIEKTLQQAQVHFQSWRLSTEHERQVTLLALAKTLRFHQDEFAQLMCREMGKPLNQGRSEVEKCAWTCEYFAQNLSAMIKPQNILAHYQESQIVFEPLGPLFAIMPWNFPLWQVFRFAVPTLAVGNVIILKHSDITAGTAELIERVMENAHPRLKLLFNLHIAHDKAEKVIADPRIRGVTVTGSTQTGRTIAELAGRHLKKCVLELGGSDAYLVLADADLSWAAKQCAAGRLINNGQSCVAAKRFIVERSVLSAFVELLKVEMKLPKMGNPELENVQLGPLASEKFQEQIIQQVEELQSWGGKIVLGGEVPEGKGAFYPATIVVFEKNNIKLGEVEIFGPVATVIAVDSAEEAIQVANSSLYGLGGGVFTADEHKGRGVLRELQVGMAVLNDFVKSDARLPFGGVKNSGFGREVSIFGLYEFCNIKTLSVGKIQ